MNCTSYSRFSRGFTLMEIIIAMAIVGILVTVSVPMYRDYTIKATVTDALAVADEGRIPVEVAFATDNKPDSALKEVMGNRPLVASGAVGVQWDDTNKAIVARANISGIGANKPVLALKRSTEGVWVCVSAAKVGLADALDEKYLPASCHGLGTARPAAAAAAKACPADQEMVMLTTGAACTAKCPAGQERDKANLSQCKAIVCGPNEEMIPDRGCLAIPPKPNCGAGSDAFRGYSANNDPNWNCMSACPPGQMPGKAFKCIPDPNAKPAAAAKPAAPVAPKPPAQLASIKCRTCIAGAEDACEVLHEEMTCTEPNNYCVTFVDNQDDGSKIVKRGCGNFERVRVEWYLGTSDDDKCRERINVEQKLAFTCTFGCTTDNCNDNLRPAEDSLYQPK
jgi:type IV pilus assembly protein PilA